MNLSPPTVPVFVISLVIAVLTLIARYAGVGIPVVSGNAFEMMLVAYLILVAGNVLRNF